MGCEWFARVDDWREHTLAATAACAKLVGCTVVCVCREWRLGEQLEQAPVALLARVSRKAGVLVVARLCVMDLDADALRALWATPAVSSYAVVAVHLQGDERALERVDLATAPVSIVNLDGVSDVVLPRKRLPAGVSVELSVRPLLGGAAAGKVGRAVQQLRRVAAESAAYPLIPTAGPVSAATPLQWRSADDVAALAAVATGRGDVGTHASVVWRRLRARFAGSTPVRVVPVRRPKRERTDADAGDGHGDDAADDAAAMEWVSDVTAGVA